MTYALSQVSRRGAEGNISLGEGICKYTIPWTSLADGSYAETITNIQGTIVRVAFIPGAAGVQPTDAYDVTLLDSEGVDVLSGQGANLSNATKSNICPGVPLKDGTTTSVVPQTVSGTLSLAIANAGNAKQGSIILYLRP